MEGNPVNVIVEYKPRCQKLSSTRDVGLSIMSSETP